VRAGRQRLGHQTDGDMFGRGGAVAAGVGRLAFFARRLHAQQQPQRAIGLAHHAERLGAAFRGPLGAPVRRGAGFLGQAQAIVPLLGGGDELGGQTSLGGVGRNERGDAGDGGAIAPEQILRPRI